jgi:hypothetical protein
VYVRSRSLKDVDTVVVEVGLEPRIRTLVMGSRGESVCSHRSAKTFRVPSGCPSSFIENRL